VAVYNAWNLLSSVRDALSAAIDGDHADAVEALVELRYALVAIVPEAAIVQNRGYPSLVITPGSAESNQRATGKSNYMLKDDFSIWIMHRAFDALNQVTVKKIFTWEKAIRDLHDCNRLGITGCDHVFWTGRGAPQRFGDPGTGNQEAVIGVPLTFEATIMEQGS